MKKRVISAIFMILIFVPILLLGGATFAIFMTALSLLGLYEFIHIREKKKPFPLIVKLFAYIMVFAFAFMNFNQNVFSYNIDYHVIAFMIFAFLIPMLFLNKEKDTYDINDALYLIGSVLFMELAFNLIVLIRNYNLNYLIYLLLITVMTDTFAYLTGSYIGKTPLAPDISPKKTVEGLVGGLLMGTFVATVFYFEVINPEISLVFLIFITFFLALVGQLGDLVFSSIKRTFQVKDYSDLIPGHGGILDRLDSLVFIVLAFILVLGIL